MFVYSVRASSARFFAALVLVMLLVGSVLVFGGTDAVFAMSEAGSAYSYSGVRNEGDREEFFRQFGVEIDPSSVEEETFFLPASFDRVLQSYNEIQKVQGLDLSRYTGKKLTRYTYTVKNAPTDGKVYANMFVYRGRVVACDISSADPTGFLVPPTDFLSLPERLTPTPVSQ